MTISGFVEYVKQIWKNKPDTSTPVSAERLNHIEEGIKRNSDALAALAAVVCDQVLNDPEKIASLAALYSVDKKIGNTANLPNSAADVVTALTTLNSNKFDKAGGKLTGDVELSQVQLYLRNGFSAWYADSRMTTLSTMPVAKNNDNRRYLELRNETYETVDKSLLLMDVKDGEYKLYSLFGEHNKPSGSYAGNGSATKRTININCSGSVLKIVTGNSFSLVTNTGAICKNDSTVSAIPHSQCKFTGGVLTIETTDPKVNPSSGICYYSVL